MTIEFDIVKVVIQLQRIMYGEKVNLYDILLVLYFYGDVICSVTGGQQKSFDLEAKTDVAFDRVSWELRGCWCRHQP